MRALQGRVDARACQRPPHDAADGHRGTEAPVRSYCANEHTPCPARRAAVPQIGRQSPPDVFGQGQRLATLPFAGQGHDTLVPVEVVQRQGGRFAGAQAQPRQQQEDGMVPPAGGRAQVAACQNRLHLLGRKRLRQLRQTPVRNRRDRAGEVGGDVPALVQVAQETAQRRGKPLGVGTGEALGMAHDEAVDIPGTQRLQGYGSCPEGLGEKRVDDRQIVDDRRRTQTALVDEKVLVGALDTRDRIVAARVFGSVGIRPPRRRWANSSRPAITPPLVFCPWSACAQEPLETLLVQGLDPKPLALEPEAEVPHKPKPGLARLAGVSLRCEPGGEAVELAGQRPNLQRPSAPRTREEKSDRHPSSPCSWRHCQPEKTPGLFRKRKRSVVV